MSTAAVELVEVEKHFGSFTALQPMSLAIAEGGFVTLLGPSGCGKTTTLRMIAGLLDPSAGEIRIKGRRINDVPIHKRNLGLVFQNYALFPHKTVFDNVAFGLRYRNVTKPEIVRRVKEALELVQLPQMADRYPKALSGGQQQRVALARAVVIEPDVLLLDEPLSALDANLREDMRVELKRIQHRIGVTSIFVTHDQAEALTLSDHIIVMSNGRVEQAGPPEEVYNRPATEFVARFLGAANILEARVREVGGETIALDAGAFGHLLVPRHGPRALRDGATAKLVVRAERLRLAPADSAPPEDAVGVPAVVETVDYQGQAARYFVRVGERQLQAVNMIDERPFAEGEAVALHLRQRDCVVLPAED